jgi:hypothetical protein
MPAAQRDVIKPPNLGEFSTNRAANSNGPLTRGASPTGPPNLSSFLHGDPGSTANLGRQASPMDPPNATKFRAGDKGMSDANAPAAVEPGKPAVPVNPFVTDAALLGRPPTATLRSK